MQVVVTMKTACFPKYKQGHKKNQGFIDTCFYYQSKTQHFGHHAYFKYIMFRPSTSRNYSDKKGKVLWGGGFSVYVTVISTRCWSKHVLGLDVCTVFKVLCFTLIINKITQWDDGIKIDDLNVLSLRNKYMTFYPLRQVEATRLSPFTGQEIRYL
jgi:hypothetical protein